MPQAVDGFNVQADDILVTVTLSHLGLVDGSALFRVVSAYGCDPMGRFIEAESCGASQAHATVVLSLGFPQRSQAAFAERLGYHHSVSSEAGSHG